VYAHKNSDLQKKVQVGGTASPSGFPEFRCRSIASTPFQQRLRRSSNPYRLSKIGVFNIMISLQGNPPGGTSFHPNELR
jgi:hypothetical protein